MSDSLSQMLSSPAGLQGLLQALQGQQAQGTPNYIPATPSGRLQVPPDWLPDSPQYLVGPRTGSETNTVIPPTPKQEDIESRGWLDEMHTINQEQQSRLDRMGEIRQQAQPGSFYWETPEYQDLNKQYEEASKRRNYLDELYKQGPTSRWADRKVGIIRNAPLDADTIWNAIQQRQQQPRDPLLIPGGSPLGGFVGS